MQKQATKVLQGASFLAASTYLYHKQQSSSLGNSHMSQVLGTHLGVRHLVQQSAEQVFFTTCDSQQEKSGAQKDADNLDKIFEGESVQSDIEKEIQKEIMEAQANGTPMD